MECKDGELELICLKYSKYANKINSSVLLNLGQIIYNYMGATTFKSTNLLELFNLICLLCKKEIATVNYLPTNEELRKNCLIQKVVYSFL